MASVGVEPTDAACAPSTATSDVLNHYTTEASPKKDAQHINISTKLWGLNMHSWVQPPQKSKYLYANIMILHKIMSP